MCAAWIYVAERHVGRGSKERWIMGTHDCTVGQGEREGWLVEEAVPPGQHEVSCWPRFSHLQIGTNGTAPGVSSVGFYSSDHLTSCVDTPKEGDLGTCCVDTLTYCGCLQGRCLKGSGLLRTVWDAANPWITVEDTSACPQCHGSLPPSHCRSDGPLPLSV